MTKGNITLEKLAEMVQHGFTSMEESINGRIDTVEGRIDTVEGRIDALDKSVGQRFDGVDAAIAAIRRQLNQAVYQHEFDVLERRVEELERKTDIRQK